MEEWKEVRLDSLVNRKICYGIVQPGFSPKNGIPVIKVNNVVKGLRDVSECDKTTEEISNSYKRTILKGGELIISLVGTVGCVDIAPSSFAGANLVRATGMIDIEDELIKHWVLYYIRTRQGQQYIEENLNTTVQRALNIKDLCKMPIPITSKHYMGRIVSILKSLDDKIEVNRRINDNLEQQAQALFKSWFVDFEPFKNGEFVESELGMIPKGWRVGTFLDNIKVMPGGTPSTSRSEYWDDGTIPFFSPKDVNGVYCFETEKSITELGLNNCSSNLYPKDTLFITARGTVGKLTLAGVPMAMNQSNYALVAREGVGKYYLYLITQTLVSVLLKKANGAVFSAITTRDFNEPTLMPTHNDLKNFELLVTPIFKKIFQTSVESRRLADLRDTLLPKLMSGELKVNEIEI